MEGAGIKKKNRIFSNPTASHQYRLRAKKGSWVSFKLNPRHDEGGLELIMFSS